MNVGKRLHPTPRRGLHVFVPVSLIVLLALFCLPVSAQAEDSSGVQYSDAIPKAEGNNTPTRKHQTPAKSSSTDEGGTTASGNRDGSGGAGGSAEGKSFSGDAEPSGSTGDTGQGSQAAGGQGGAGALQPGAQTASDLSAAQSEDDGSSPLVPILIAIAILAAISVAAVMLRQRRQRRGPTATASPEAN